MIQEEFSGNTGFSHAWCDSGGFDGGLDVAHVRNAPMKRKSTHYTHMQEKKLPAIGMPANRGVSVVESRHAERRAFTHYNTACRLSSALNVQTTAKSS